MEKSWKETMALLGKGMFAVQQAKRVWNMKRVFFRGKKVHSVRLRRERGEQAVLCVKQRRDDGQKRRKHLSYMGRLAKILAERYL